MSQFSDRPPSKEDLPRFILAAKIVVAVVRLEQIDPSSQSAADRAFALALRGTREEAEEMLRGLEDELRKRGKQPMFFGADVLAAQAARTEQMHAAEKDDDGSENFDEEDTR